MSTSPQPATAGRIVADVMLTDVKISSPDTTVGELRAMFQNSHVHLAVIVDRGLLLALVDRLDLRPEHRDETPAHEIAQVDAARVIAPDVGLAHAWQTLLASGGRRLVVVEPDGTFLGLLCLKRSRTGFCSNRDIRSRRRERDELSHDVG